MTATQLTSDECYRCGYDLRGIGDDQPCPECGLLAGRSRRPTDELHDTRPRWLRSLSIGVAMILVSIVLTPVALLIIGPFEEYLILNPPRWMNAYYAFHIVFAGFDVTCLLFFCGIWMLTRREGYAPADRADRRLRISLRIAALIPMMAMGLVHVCVNALIFSVFSSSYNHPFDRAAPWFVVIAVVSAILPILLFIRLRGVARRARSAHLAEHCLILGIGCSASILYVTAACVVISNADKWGFSHNWIDRSPVSLTIVLLMFLAVVLFGLWSLYLLVRFQLAFSAAARKLKHQWRRDDRAM